MELCRICKEEIDRFEDCLCTRDKPGMREAVNWLTKTDAFEGGVGKKLADIVKIMDTPITRLDTKMASQPQIAATVLAIYAEHHKKAAELNRQKEVLFAKNTISNRKKYDSLKGTTKETPVSIFNHRITIDPEYDGICVSLIKAQAATTFLSGLVKSIEARGNILNTMSNDRRQKMRIDVKSSI